VPRLKRRKLLALEGTVPLSEEELRLLEQMERALVAEDPKFASTLRGTRIRQHVRRQVIAGVLVFIVGIALLMAGAVLRITPLGIAGFVVMLASAYFALSTWRGPGPLQPTPPPTATPQGLQVIPGGKASRRTRSRKPKQHGTMMERLEERWRRRREENGGF
jgi:hypothetical protein